MYIRKKRKEKEKKKKKRKTNRTLEILYFIISFLYYIKTNEKYYRCKYFDHWVEPYENSSIISIEILYLIDIIKYSHTHSTFN